MSCLPTFNGKRYKNIRDLIVQNNLEKKALDYFKIKSINEQKVEPSRQLDLFEDSTPELQDFFSGLEKYTGKTPSKNGLKTIPNNITSISKFEGTPIEYVDLIGYTPSGVRIGARNINRGEKILVDLEAMKEKFESKAWATTTQTVPLAEDAFKTYQELIMFMFLHEKAHEYILKNPLETKYDYENRVNEEALRRLQEEYDTTTQTEEGLEYSPIKEEGVKELFESNLELANEVYEALGVEIKNFKLILNNEKHEEDANTYDVIYNNEKIGIVTLFEGKNKVIKGVKFDEKFKNKGLGKKLYKFLNLQANLQGGVLFSDPEQQSADARRLWNSLIKEGVVNRATADEQTLRFNIDYKQQAQQLYSQYLESLNKPNTNPILQGNQEEQVKKFAELQERLNNKEFLEGAKNAYESSKGLQEWGTQEQYNDYIVRVSLGIIKNPSSGSYNYTSKVKDIVYHGTSHYGFDKFSRINLGSSDKAGIAGFDFTKDINTAKRYTRGTFKSSNLPGIYSVLLNVTKFRNGLVDNLTKEEQATIIDNLSKNNYIDDDVKKTLIDYSERDTSVTNLIGRVFTYVNLNEGVEKAESALYKILDILNVDGEYQGKELFIDNRNKVTVFKPEQIHILGSKQDIEGFKSWVDGNKSNVQNQKQTDLQAEQDAVLEEFANSLSERFNISFDLISEEEAKSMFPKYTNEPAFFDPKTKKAYLVKGKANKTSAIHEIFTHPFLLQIEKTNPTLYKNLLKEAKNNKSVVDYVDNLSQSNNWVDNKESQTGVTESQENLNNSTNLSNFEKLGFINITC